MRLYIPFFIFLHIATNLCGQNKQTEKHTYFDASWQETNEKNARYHVRHQKLGDTAWLIGYYKGTLLESKTGVAYNADLRTREAYVKEHGKESFFPGGEAEWQRYLNRNVK